MKGFISVYTWNLTIGKDARRAASHHQIKKQGKIAKDVIS